MDAMIKVTRLNQNAFVLNHALIKYVDSCPDTTITLINDEKVIVREPVETLVDRVIEYERRVRVFNKE